MKEVKLLLPKFVNQEPRKIFRKIYRKISEVLSPLNGKSTYFIAIPGFIDYHLHLGSCATFTFPRNLERYIKLEETLWRTPEDQKKRKEIEKLMVSLSLSSGVTEIYAVRGFDLKKEEKFPIKTGIPVVAEGYLSSFFEKVNELIFDSKNSPYIFIHSVYRTKEIQIKRALKIAEEHNLNVFMHFMENSWEREYIARRFNVENPIEALRKLNFVPEKTYLIHCTFLKADELEELIEKGYKIVLCPYSNLNFNRKIPKIDEKVFYEGVISGKILFGSDGIGNGRSTLVENVKLATLYYGFPYTDLDKMKGLLSSCGLQIYEIDEPIKVNKFIEAMQWIMSSPSKPAIIAYTIEDEIVVKKFTRGNLSGIFLWRVWPWSFQEESHFIL